MQGQTPVISGAKNSSGTIIDAVTIIKGAVVSVKDNNLKAKTSGIYDCGKNVFEISFTTGTRYMIVDVNGKIVLRCTAATAQERIDLSRLMKGLYIVKISSHDQNVVRKVIVK